MLGSPGVGRTLRIGRIASLVFAIFLLAVAFPLAIGEAGAQSTPSGIVYSVPMTVTNSQGEATPDSFTLMVTVDFSQYSSYAAPGLQNVEFYTPEGTVIPSWLESGSSSSSAVFWLRLGGIPANSAGTIFMGFASPSTNLFAQGFAGEAPELSAKYGQYDNGFMVFPFYDNFQGNALGSGWVDNSAASGSPVTVNNGLTVGSASSKTVLPAVYSSNDFPTPAVLEFYTTIQASSSSYGQAVGLMDSSNCSRNNIAVGSIGAPTNGLWTTSDGNANPESGLAFNTPSLYSISVPGQSPSNTIAATVNYGSPSYTSLDVPTVSLPVGFFNGASSGGPLGPTYWVRVRAYPPNGVMPTVSIGSAAPTTTTTTGTNTNGSIPWFYDVCNPPTVTFGSSTMCQAVGRGENGTVPTGTVSWLASGPGGMTPSGFSPPQCTLTSGSCSASFTPPSSASPVAIVANYSGDSNYPHFLAKFMLNVVSSTGTVTTNTINASTIVTTTVTSGNFTSVVTRTVTTGPVTSGTYTSGTTTTTSSSSGLTLPSLPSVSVTPFVPFGVMAAMIVVVVYEAANWARGKGGAAPKPPAEVEDSGPKEGSG
jgi:hypothetical protein